MKPPPKPPGCRAFEKTRLFGEKTLITEFILARDGLGPLPAPLDEPTGYRVKRRLRLQWGDKEFDACPGQTDPCCAGRTGR